MSRLFLFIALCVFTSCDEGEVKTIDIELPESGRGKQRDFSFTEKLKTGDIVFINCKSDLSTPISLATNSGYTHCGMVYKTNTHDWFVAEAYDTSSLTHGVDFFNNSSDNSVLILRLRSMKDGFNKETIQKLDKIFESRLGLPYDGRFLWNDEEMYCSELVYKIYSDLGVKLCKLKKLGDFDLSSPEVQKELNERYGNEIPLKEPMIAPVDLIYSPLLDTIYYIK